MENKYYSEIKTKIKDLIAQEKYNEVTKIINEELSMPYIPMEFEKFLIETLDSLPLGDNENSFSFSLEKIVDLLIKLDESQSDYSDLISQLKKFNLVNEKDELEYYFNKSKNKRNRAMIFELLIKEKADIECEYGNTSTAKSVTESDQYLSDKEEIEKRLDKYQVLIEPSVKLLDEIYLTKHLGQELTGSYADMVIFTLSKIFGQEELIEDINDFDELKNKLENFKSFENYK